MEPTMKLCLNMIVKNEAKRIERALKSCVNYIDCYAIVDTGSTDDTIAVIKSFFKAHKIPGVIGQAPFKDWSQARNAALATARGVRDRFHFDYMLLMDADMELSVKDRAAFLADRSGSAYDMYQRSGTLQYLNRRLVKATEKGGYRGVTHEYLDIATDGELPESIAYFIDHADGANRPSKFKRDISLLLEGLKTEPNNERYYYYLAQSFRDAGQTDDAMCWYRKRVAAGGWAEEQWSAQLYLAHCYKDKGDEEGFIREMLIAYNMRPSRAESMYDLARYFRDAKDRQVTAALFAEIGMGIPRTNDALFVNDYVYDVGLKEEFSICAFYVPHLREKGFKVTDELSQQVTPYWQAREGARNNMYWYLPKITDLCPSFKWQMIPFKADQGWTAMNPSVTLHKGQLQVLVRTVNYKIDEHGRYLIRGTDGTANATNPINTRNWLMPLNDDFSPAWLSADEILLPDNLPCEFPLVIGFEDSRLFSWKDQLWTSSTVRQIHHDGNCEQVLAPINRRVGAIAYGRDWKRMLPEKRGCEKNWTPIVQGDDLSFMYYPGVRVDTDGKIIQNTPPTTNTDNLNGGTQLIQVGPLRLSLVHSARQIPGSSCRYYYHRVIAYDERFHVIKVGRPFVFHDKVIEFASGMCHHPSDPTKLVISYGYKDNEARIATVSIAEVMRLLWGPFKS
jgi:glycosyltransferase involved in cell wall biosynthesis